MHSPLPACPAAPATRPSFRRKLILVLAALAGLGVVAFPAVAADEQAPRDYALRFSGSGTMGGLVSAWLEEFLRAEGWTDLKRLPAAEGRSYTLAGRPAGGDARRGVYVEVSDPEAALATLSQGLADIALSTRRARPAEAERARALGDLLSPACEHPVGLDALAVIVPASNPVVSLTREQLRELFQRRLTSWQDLGATGPVHLFAREEKSGATELFRAAILGGGDLAAAGVERMDDSAALSAAVAVDPRALGFVSLAFAGGNRVLALAAEPDSPPKAPVEEVIRSGEYPLARRLYLYTAAAPENALALKFIRFAEGSAGQALVAKAGFLPLAAPPPPPPPPAAAVVPSPPLPVTTPPPAPTPPPAAKARANEDDESAAPARRGRATLRPTPKPAAAAQRAPTAAPRGTPARPRPTETRGDDASTAPGG